MAAPRTDPSRNLPSVSRRKRVAAWSAAWSAVAVAAVVLAVRECAECSATGAIAFAGGAALVIAAGAWCAVVAAVWVWAYTVALTTSVWRALTGAGSRADYWTAAFVCSVLGAAAAFLVLISRDVAIGAAELGAAAVLGAVVMLYVWTMASSIVSVFKGTASPAEWRNALAGAIILVVVAWFAVWAWRYMAGP